MEDFGYREVLKEKSDRYLFEMVTVNQHQYDYKALKDAEAILRERKVDIEQLLANEDLIDEMLEKEIRKNNEETRKSRITVAVLWIAGGLGLSIFLFFLRGIGTTFIGACAILYGLYNLIREYLPKQKTK
ncbi:MAG: hypothetical protein K0S33_1916 [Bacteroidetes bacterium]|jgi:UDP-N-acetylglucosamine pyrophosphorylase|nr:hypothetical protein [Bacteroidota bacterium]